MLQNSEWDLRGYKGFKMNNKKGTEWRKKSD